VAIRARATTAAVGGDGSTAQQCGVDQNRPPQRVFSNEDGKHGWRESQSVEDLPELDPVAGDLAGIWAGRDGNALITIEEFQDQFASYTDYCFDKTDKLVRVRFELRTAWEWGYREDGRIVNGALVSETPEFFSTKTGQRIDRPAKANAIARALKPRLYIRKSDLPFSALLAK